MDKRILTFLFPGQSPYKGENVHSLNGSSPPFQSKNDSSPSRFVGLDLFRGVAAYGIVLSHFYLLERSDPSLHWVIQLRDCIMPFFILSSFFVLTISFEKKQERSFRGFFSKRLRRIWVPFILWTVLYICFWNVFAPLIRREPIHWRSFPAMLLTGYIHLWFLQFIFIGSLALFPLLRFFTRHKESRRWFSLGCVTVGFLFATSLSPMLRHPIHLGWLSQLDENLSNFIREAIKYLHYIPLAVGMGLVADDLLALYQYRFFRIATLLCVPVWICIYFGIPALPFNREVYSLVVFVALLRPLRKLAFRRLSAIGEYSYAIYLLHMWALLIAVSVLYRTGMSHTTGVILMGSVIAFGVTLFSSVLLRKLFPWDGLLPLIPIYYGNRRSGEFAN